MPIPNQTITITDPGLRLVEPAPTTPLFMGTCQSGTVDTLYSFANKNDAVAALGQGELTEDVCKALDFAGGPVFAMRLTGSVVGVSSAVTKVAIGASTGTVTLAGAPFAKYRARIEILVSGALGAGTFRYSLDRGTTDPRTWSEELVIPSGGTFAIPSTNISATFVPGAGPVFFEDGDTHSWTSTAPYYSTANIATAVTALLAQTEEFPFICLVGEPANAAGAATVFAALDTHSDAFATANRYVRWVMDYASIDTTSNVQTSLGTVEGARIMPVYGLVDATSSKPFAGYGAPRRSGVGLLGAWAAAQLMSTDLARVALGSIPGVLGLVHDENLTQALDVYRCSTFRSFVGRSGFYVTNGRLKSAAGSDFRYWQHGRVMDVATRQTFIAQQGFLSSGVRTNADGTIDERDAARLEAIVNGQLREQLTQPANAEGTRGHVSAVTYRIDRTNNIITSETLRSEVAIRPLGYSKLVVTQIGYSLEA